MLWSHVTQTAIKSLTITAFANEEMEEEKEEEKKEEKEKKEE